MYNKKRNTALLASITILAVIAAGMVVFSTIFALLNHTNENIIEGVSILGEDVSKMSKTTALAKINNKLSERLSTDIVLQHGEETYTFLPEQIDLKYDTEDAIEKAYNIGRDSDLVTNNFTIIKTKKEKADLQIKVTLNQEKLDEIMGEINDKFSDGIKQPTYTVEGNNLTITSGTPGSIADVPKLAELILKKEQSKDFSSDSIEIPTTQKNPDGIDIDKVHNEIYKDAVDATFTKNPYKITSSETGLDFSISTTEAKEMLKENKPKY